MAGSWAGVDTRLRAAAEYARQVTGEDYSVRQGTRTAQEAADNARKGTGVKNSLHIPDTAGVGHAADIYRPDGSVVSRAFAAAMQDYGRQNGYTVRWGNVPGFNNGRPDPGHFDLGLNSRQTGVAYRDDMQRAATEQGIATRQEDIATQDFPVASSNASVESYIRQSAAARGIDPDVAVRVAKSEGGLADPFKQSDVHFDANGNIVKKGGTRETSFGPFQLRIGGGLGDLALKAGIDPRQDWQQGVDFALNYAAKNGWGSWQGAVNPMPTSGYSPISRLAGLDGAQPVAVGSVAPVSSPSLSAGYPTTTASLLFGGGGSNMLAGGDRAPVTPQPAQVGGGQPLSPYVRGDFFPTPAPTLQPHVTAPMSYTPAAFTAIQPYSTQPAMPLPHPGQESSGFTQQDTGGLVQHISGPTAPPQQYTPPPAAALPVAPSDFTLSDLMHAQSGGVGQDIFGGGQAPAAAPMPGGTPAPVQVAPVGHPVHDFLQHIVQNVVPNIPSIFQHLTGGASGPGVTGPLPAGVSSNNAVGALLGGQSWHAPSLFNSSGGVNPSGGSSYNYFSPSSPGGIGGYMTSTGHIYTYPTDPDIYHSVAS